MMTTKRTLSSVIVLAIMLNMFLCASKLVAEDTKATVSFEQEVLPILKRRCYVCHSHSNGEMEGGLALDWKSGWEIGGDSGPAIIPNKPDESLLIEAINRDSLEMPPEEPLPQSEIDVLVKWITTGANDPRIAKPEKQLPSADWWSLKPLVNPELPDGNSESNPIDRFISAKLTEVGLNRSPSADKKTLLRRLYYDLLGLPPTAEQVAAFLDDKRPDAYQILVEKLLDSPRHGERWARHWLDVIHFADTHGFEHDVFREHAWRFRDYVIEALNADLGWGDFIRQQLAVDVFSPERTDLIPALGFLGAGPFDLSTASTAPVTFEYMDRDDLVTQTMAAFVSTTANCARCHAHKFDPITQEDYYALQAVFAGVGKGDRTFDADPKTDQQRKYWQEVLADVASNVAEKLLTEEHQKRVHAWEVATRQAPVTWNPATVTEFLSTDGADLKQLEDGSILVSGVRPDVDTYSVTLTTEQEKVTAVRLDVLADETLPMHGPGRQDNGNLHLNHVEILRYPADSNEPQKLPIAQASADFNQAGWTIAHAIDADLKTAWGIYPEVGKSHHAVFTLQEPIEVQPGQRLVVLLKQRHGGGHLIGRFKISLTQSPAESAIALPTTVAEALSTPPEQRSQGASLAIARYALKMIAEQELAKLPDPVKVYAAASSIERGTEKGTPLPIRDVHVLARGNIERPKEAALPGALSAISTLQHRFDLNDTNDESARRAALAEWIASPENPLTWRSIANRIWQFHFGRGLCDTPSDFGQMGATPSHPELLDFLAIELRDHGGSLKHLHRLILTSETYRQVSRNDQAAAQIDADNKLLWRANRQRLDAESFYDSVLQISGKLDLQMYGPGIQYFTTSPGQQVTPQVHYDKYDWSNSGSGRRAIYRVVWRGIPDPLFDALDFPDLGLLAPQRTNSVSALQSLVLWNHPFVLHHCEATAAKNIEQSPEVPQQVKLVFQRILLREPTDNELAEMTMYAQEHGLAATVRLLFNSNEFLYVN